MCEKRRGFFVIFAFAALFILAILTATVPTLFVRGDLPAYFESWALSAGRVQAISYLVAFWETIVLFGMLYRVVPNAGQRIVDVWAGTLTAATLFMAMAQVFPIYLGLIGGANRFGALFGLVSLLVAWFFVLAHVLLFGAYINATMQRRQRRRAFQQATREQAREDPAQIPDHDADSTSSSFVSPPQAGPFSQGASAALRLQDNLYPSAETGVPSSTRVGCPSPVPDSSTGTEPPV